jgi:hypothetical protein
LYPNFVIHRYKVRGYLWKEIRGFRNLRRNLGNFVLTMPMIGSNIINGWAGANALSRPAEPGSD